MIEVLTYLVHLLVFSQPFIWWWFYNQHFPIPRIVDFLSGFIVLQTVLTVIALGVRYEYYSTSLVVQYILLVYFAYHMFKDRFSISDAIALSFLTVYMNSYYWESVLHFQEYTLHILSGDIFINYRELWRLTPVLFFIRKFKFDKEHTVNWLSYGLFFSFIVVIYNFGLVNNYNLLSYGVRIYDLRNMVFFINRIVCEFIIVKVVVDAEKVEPDEKMANQDVAILQEG